MKIFLCFSILFLLSQYSIAAPPGNPFRYNPDTGPPAPFPAAASAQPAAAQPAAAQPADRPHDNSNGGRQRPARDYKCSLCGKEYTNSKNLGYIAHMVQDDHIADTGEKKDGHPVYKCIVPGCQTNHQGTWDRLRHHMQRVHGRVPVPLRRKSQKNLKQ